MEGVNRGNNYLIDKISQKDQANILAYLGLQDIFKLELLCKRAISELLGDAQI